MSDHRKLQQGVLIKQLVTHFHPREVVTDCYDHPAFLAQQTRQRTMDGDAEVFGGSGLSKINESLDGVVHCPNRLGQADGVTPRANYEDARLRNQCPSFAMWASVTSYSFHVTSLGYELLLSPPHLGDGDREAVLAALDSGWLAPVGPDLLRFEDEMARYLSVSYAVALTSGTAALHLALRYVGVRPGDVVLVPSVTFAATAFAVTYLGATPVFVDIEGESWGMDPGMTEQAVIAMTRRGHRVAGALPVDLYGSPANYSTLLPIFSEYGIPVVEDAAEGLGAEFGQTKLGSLGNGGVLSFNGNKLITSSGGGMLVTGDPLMAEKVRKWSTQSRDEAPWYEHTEIGYNYRLSNILAALGRSQLSRVDSEVAKRRLIREWYRETLSGVPGVCVQADPPWGRSNAWLTVIRIDGTYTDGATRVREALAAEGIESRPVWKPMHQQHIFRDNPNFMNGSADHLFAEGLCLPSGTQMTADVVERVSSVVIRTLAS